MPTYILSSGSGKPKMDEAEGAGDASCMPLPPPQNPPLVHPPISSSSAKNITMAALADTLHNFAGGYLDQPVVDQTNLAGNWNLTLKWTARNQLEKQGADGISIFAAVDKQLGLKLELKTAPRPVFQVVSVDETPTPNAPNLAEALPEPPAAPFEVATIKPSAPGEQGYGRISGDQIDTRATPLIFLIHFAWDPQPQQQRKHRQRPQMARHRQIRHSRQSRGQRPRRQSFPPATSSTTKTSATCSAPSSPNASR